MTSKKKSIFFSVKNIKKNNKKGICNQNRKKERENNLNKQ